ncbi:helix-turn-helix domain-containing protein [uncultured Oscillibacter sp.]|uniref:helix-turn-helix domain-containing protein n=1 Tax=uncultured Oscillibacter sp. TaxID=876091 RepID=UPI0035A62348
MVPFSGVIWLYLRRIYDLREDHDYTQKAVAEYLEIHPNVYRRYEKGTRTFPLDLIIKLADFYGVSTDYLLGRTDVPTPYPPVKTK